MSGARVRFRGAIPRHSDGMEELNRAKRESADVIRRYYEQVKIIAETELPFPATERQVAFASIWFVSVMHAPEQIVNLLRDPKFRASEGFRSISEVSLPAGDGSVPAGAEEVDVPFSKALAALINKYSIESKSNTPDFILAQFLTEILDAYAKATYERDRWYGDWAAVPPRSCADKVPGDGV